MKRRKGRRGLPKPPTSALPCDVKEKPLNRGSCAPAGRGPAPIRIGCLTGSRPAGYSGQNARESFVDRCHQAGARVISGSEFASTPNFVRKQRFAPIRLHRRRRKSLSQLPAMPRPTWATASEYLAEAADRSGCVFLRAGCGFSPTSRFSPSLAEQGGELPRSATKPVIDLGDSSAKRRYARA